MPDDLVHLRVGVVSLGQSQLTGESLPVEATAGATAYTGSRVGRGEASGTVTATADRTRFGKTAQLVQLPPAPKRLQRLAVSIAKYLLALDVTLIAIVVIAAVLRHTSVSNTLPFALMVLVASVPVMLPPMFTMSSAMGARGLAKNGVMTTRLSAIEDAATMDVLCVDKTGTITENRLAVTDVAPLGNSNGVEVLRLAALASEEATQDPIDLAVLSAARARWVAVGDGASSGRRRFVPFDRATKRSEAEIATDGGAPLHVVKGAPATLAEMAGVPYAEIEPATARLAAGGSRVLAVASGNGDALHLDGLVTLADPPRADSAKFVEDLHREGVRVVLVTGDGADTARAVAAKVGITGEVAPAGSITDDLDAATAERYSVYAEVYPEQKYQLVKALQDAGHVVGMTGDGVNDAAALGQADVGVAVAGATDVAKASAALALTKEGLGEILSAVRGSRTIYQRLQSWGARPCGPQGGVPAVPRPRAAHLGGLPALPAARGAVHAPRRNRHLRAVHGPGRPLQRAGPLGRPLAGGHWLRLRPNAARG